MKTQQHSPENKENSDDSKHLKSVSQDRYFPKPPEESKLSYRLTKAIDYLCYRFFNTDL